MNWHQLSNETKRSIQEAFTDFDNGDTDKYFALCFARMRKEMLTFTSIAYLDVYDTLTFRRGSDHVSTTRYKEKIIEKLRDEVQGVST